MIPSIVICDTKVRSDHSGTYNLNDMHKAAISAGKAKHWQKPSQFLANTSVKEYVEEVSRMLNPTLEQNQILAVYNGGNKAGVWAHELIAMRYASWLSPAFEVMVYQVFRQFILGSISKFQQANMLELEYQNKKKKVSRAAREMNLWGRGGEKRKIEAARISMQQDIQLLIPDLGKPLLNKP